MVASNHVAELCLGIRERRRIRPIDIPINWNLRPHQQSHAIGQTNLIFVVRVMSESDEIASQLFHPPEKRLRILLAECPPFAKWRLLVHGNSPQENRLSVQQNLVALRLDCSEANLIAHAIRTAGRRTS